MIRWRLTIARLVKAGMANPHQLAEGAEIGYPAATLMWKRIETGAKLTRFDFTTLEALAAKLGVKPLSLLEHVDEPRKRSS